MINKKSKKGFGAYEMLTLCVIFFIIIVVVLANVFKTDYSEKYRVLQYNARMFGLSVANYSLTNDTKDIYYLQELMDQRIYSKIKNPFQGEKYCDSMVSKVEIQRDKKYVTLQCGNYLIAKEDFLLKKYKIYQVTEWSVHKKSQDNESRKFYNYVKDNEEVFSTYMEQDYFLYEYNKQNGTSYSSIKEMDKDVIIKEKKMYRHKQVVHG